MLGFDGEAPLLLGFTTTVTVDLQDGTLYRFEEPTWSRWSVADGTVAPSPWDPPQSGDLVGLRVVPDDAGGTVVLGVETTRPSNEALADEDREADEQDVVGWFRAAPGASWTPTEGLSGPRTETLRNVFWLGDQWIAVGADRDSITTGSHQYAAVWTSDDGVRWNREEGPFEVSRERSSQAKGACRLPGDGGVFVVGEADGKSGDSIRWPGGNPAASGGAWAGRRSAPGLVRSRRVPCRTT